MKNFLLFLFYGLISINLFILLIELKNYVKFFKFNMLIKGSIEDVELQHNKIYFVIKWKTPTLLIEKNPNDQMGYGVQFYYHIFKENINKISSTQLEILKSIHLNKSFYLHAAVRNGIIKEIKNFQGHGKNLFIYFLSCIFLSFCIYLIKII